MRFKNFYVLILLVVSISFANDASALSKMWVIQVTQADQGIGSARDKVRFKAEVETAARMANMELNFKSFDRYDSGIGTYIHSISPGADDVIWFYYSGHGRNSEIDTWPEFDNSENTFKLSKIYSTIKNKPCRLKIAMYDCCNVGSNVTRNSRDVGSVLPASAYVFLFKNSKGSIIVSSSKTGQFSYGDPNVGGFFTDSFFRAIGQVSYNTASEQANIWNNVLNKTVSNTRNLCGSNIPQQQVPQYKVELEGTNNVVNPVAAPDDKKTGAKDF